MDEWTQPKRWAVAMAAAALLGVLALLSNITTWDQLSGRANELLTARFFLSKLVNSGTAWAGLLVLAGWLVRRRRQAVIAGIVAGELALLVHYGLGEVIGGWLAIPPAGFLSNEIWFIAAALFGAPLGLIGALAHRRDQIGRMAGLVVPIGAVIEPFFRGSFRVPEILPWAERTAECLSGIMLVLFGLLLAIRVLGLCRRVPQAPWPTG